MNPRCRNANMNAAMLACCTHNALMTTQTILTKELVLLPPSGRVNKWLGVRELNTDLQLSWVNNDALLRHNDFIT